MNDFDVSVEVACELDGRSRCGTGAARCGARESECGVNIQSACGERWNCPAPEADGVEAKSDGRAVPPGEEDIHDRCGCDEGEEASREQHREGDELETDALEAFGADEREFGM